MARHLSTKISDDGRQKLTDSDLRWKAMLSAVNSEISKAEKRLVDLHASARFVEGKLASGEPFPEHLLGTAI